MTCLSSSSMPISAVGALTVNGNALKQNRNFCGMSSFIRLAGKVSSGFPTVVLIYTPAEFLPAYLKLPMILWAARLFQSFNTTDTIGAK